jgi:hypothetical protein
MSLLPTRLPLLVTALVTGTDLNCQVIPITLMEVNVSLGTVMQRHSLIILRLLHDLLLLPQLNLALLHLLVTESHPAGQVDHGRVVEVRAIL